VAKEIDINIILFVISKLMIIFAAVNQNRLL